MKTNLYQFKIGAGNSPITGAFPLPRPVTRSFDVFFYLCLNKRLSKQSWAGDLSRHRARCDVTVMHLYGVASILINVESGTGLLPDGANPLLEPTHTP